MALTSYSGLVTAVGSWLERDDVAALVPDWIALVEARLNRALRVSKQVVRSTATISDEFSELPGDFLAPRSMRLTGGDKRVLAYLTPEQMGEYKATSPSGVLNAYAIVGGEFEYGPTPVDATEVALTYFATIPALTSTNTTNWVLESHPDAYLRGCLLEAAIYYQDAEQAAANAQLFADAVSAIEADDRRSGYAATITPTPSAYAI